MRVPRDGSGRHVRHGVEGAAGNRAAGATDLRVRLRAHWLRPSWSAGQAPRNGAHGSRA